MVKLLLKNINNNHKCAIYIYIYIIDVKLSTNGDIHKGIFYNGKLVKGTKTNKLRVIEGKFKNEKLDGAGKIIYENGTQISGHFVMGKLNGKGTSPCDIYIYIYIYRRVFQ